MNRKLKVDLSGDRPSILCDGEIVGGVTRAEIYLEPNELPLLVLMVNMFDVEGGSLPPGWEPGKPYRDTE
ncbi:hypothetical protein SAMN05443245_6847 [Paraburkholderia fungorum]|uniref:Uncharacterized protein n=1 Tax=Paraburkholderia fungorum TaxID=134537 RepID=A0A1H1JMI4_9BURK|nr:hypothetical protein [Paraburkholderia fungorum]SDR51152.1 hypothetical protein SAMN05443245_6847 [Paraburkholderia fungorum]